MLSPGTGREEMVTEDNSNPAARDFVYTGFASQPKQVNHIYFPATGVSWQANQH